MLKPQYGLPAATISCQRTKETRCRMG